MRTLELTVLLVGLLWDSSAVAEESAAEVAILTVEAIPVRPEGGDPAPKLLSAAVMLNGFEVGFTPYTDKLAPGNYTVEVWLDGREVHTQRIDARPGESYVVTARVVVPLTKQEIAEKQAKQRAADEAAHQADYESWRKAYAEWDQQTGPSRHQRKMHVGLGILMSLVGPGLVITGAACLSAANRYDSRASEAASDWRNETDPSTIESLADVVEENQQRRDTAVGWGAATLAVGGAAIIGAIVVFATTPKVEKAPKEPAQIATPGLSLQSATPLPMRGGAGVAVSFVF